MMTVYFLYSSVVRCFYNEQRKDLHTESDEKLKGEIEGNIGRNLFLVDEIKGRLKMDAKGSRPVHQKQELLGSLLVSHTNKREPVESVLEQGGAVACNHEQPQKWKMKDRAIEHRW